MTTSATGGPLTPTNSPAPLEGDALANFFHDWFVGLTGLPASMVRPRWQPEPAALPQVGTDWMAFGITNRASDVNAAELHFSSGAGYNELRRHEVLTIMVSVYGPNADSFIEVLRDGMQLGQNREVLVLAAMGLVESGDVVSAPELIKDKWYYRTDMSIRIRRQIVRQYAVETLQSANIGLDNEHYITQINV